MLGGTQGSDKDVAVGRLGGPVEDGGGGAAGGGEEGEVRGDGAGVDDGGGVGGEVEAEEAGFEAPVFLGKKGGFFQSGVFPLCFVCVCVCVTEEDRMRVRVCIGGDGCA